MNYDEKSELLDAVWRELSIEDKERMLVNDGWEGVLDNLKDNEENYTIKYSIEDQVNLIEKLTNELNDKLNRGVLCESCK